MPLLLTLIFATVVRGALESCRCWPIRLWPRGGGPRMLTAAAGFGAVLAAFLKAAGIGAVARASLRQPSGPRWRGRGGAGDGPCAHMAMALAGRRSPGSAPHGWVSRCRRHPVRSAPTAYLRPGDEPVDRVGFAPWRWVPSPSGGWANGWASRRACEGGAGGALVQGVVILGVHARPLTPYVWPDA